MISIPFLLIKHLPISHTKEFSTIAASQKFPSRPSSCKCKTCFRAASFLFFLLITGCESTPPEALGTLEWDRVNSRAVASEVISELFVRQGEKVSRGTVLLQLDNRKLLARIDETEAQLLGARWLLKEQVAGPRQETIAKERARVDAARAVLDNAHAIYERRELLYKGNFVSQEQRDIARKNYLDASAILAEQEEALAELTAGTREEKIEQAKAHIQALESKLAGLKLLLEDYRVSASRDGLVDSLPYKLGDRPPEGAVLATLLSGRQPWARVYIPEPFRAGLEPGEEYTLSVDGISHTFNVTLRSISSEASFTPYYALSEKDRSRLTYVAVLDFPEKSASSLTAGTPVQLILKKP